MTARIDLENFTQTDNHKRFDLYLDVEGKRFLAIPNGIYTKEDSDAAGAAYMRIVNSIIPSEYTFILECNDLDTSTPALVEELVNLMRFYEATRFKRVVLLRPKSLEASKQLEKVIRISGVTMEVVDAL